MSSRLPCGWPSPAAKEKKARKATLGKRSGSVYATAAAASSMNTSSTDIPAVAVSAPPAAFTRSGENSVRATWGPQSAARLEEALYALSRGGPAPGTLLSNARAVKPLLKRKRCRWSGLSERASSGGSRRPASRAGEGEVGLQCRARWRAVDERWRRAERGRPVESELVAS